MTSTARRLFLRSASAVALLAASSLSAFAQDYPKRPVTIVVPFSAGGGTDSIARELAKGLSEKLGQPVIIDNRGGGGGVIASRQVAKADPDGYTLLFVTSTFVTHAAVDSKQTYDVNKDYAPIAMIGRGPLMVVTHKGVGAKSVQDLVAKSRSRPEGLDFCSSGTGSVTHLAGELFKQKTGANLVHVPYKGSNPATIDFLAGRTQVFFATMPTMLQHVKAGSVEVLAMTGTKRSALFPNVPTVAEAGIRGFQITTWWGLVAPAGTPDAIVSRLNKLINEEAAKEPLKSRLISEGAEAYRTTPAEFRAMLGAELQTWRDVAKASNIKMD
ncbi:tripartite tricarboxylate transporter substrate binding protein [Noviherbaspirillum denitrificans]|uniref:Fis family transcriptional regulator n=1 Tax=Noviherbaspirillum denitrificans TaxID=1968433 RepID=A0A254TL46_9BURK|nr:tripartite tricarboxylate transporter substrate binding protein [Noviherbaspirillum denitrificans]OWW20428.1 Fis family transcriptional regulator [Noviherbaspirillum denitrificans]